ncbi:hypothetical protein [Bacillus cereus]|uniref:Uncharacterized protein n=1 Tax=Bacillus cereus TaxID=1396 RepID=A0A9X7A0M7_BACCE|nr:hypothetical protein [Bacillus cereus]PFK23963.1 hypothetical protein COI98_06385 [Bacillus cereus]
MKNRIKKTMRKTVVGFALLSGIIVAGGNSASAEEHSYLKDKNGHAVEYGAEYYIQLGASILPNYGNYWVGYNEDLDLQLPKVIGPMDINNDLPTFTIEKTVADSSGNVIEELSDDLVTIRSTWENQSTGKGYFSVNPQNDINVKGPQSSGWSTDMAKWKPVKVESTVTPEVEKLNLYQFKNPATNKLITSGGSQGSGSNGFDYLYARSADEPRTYATTWRLVKK